MLNIICVLKHEKGSPYNKDYVLRLAHSVRRNLPMSHRVICLTDDIRETVYDENNCIQWEPLLHNWPRWWSKVEMWRPDLERYGRFLYIDLDMVVTGDLTDIASYDGDAAVTYDFGYDVPSQTLMNYAPGACREIWDTFNKNPDKWMQGGDEMKAPFWGDQILTTKAFSGTFDNMQKLFPGQIRSFKMECSEALPQNTRIVSFHGSPKPHGVSLDWVSKNWV